MTSSLGRTISTLALAAGLSVATAGTAAAEELTVTDGRGDVQVLDMTADGWTAAPGVKNGDVSRAVLRHDDRRIAVRVKFRDLARKGSMSGHVVRVVTDEGVKRDVNIFAGPGMWGGEAMMSRPSGQEVACQVAHKIAYGTNLVTLSFPRTCISDPRWVRLGFGTMWMDGTSTRYYGDDAQIDGELDESRLHLSPRLRRG